MTYRVLKFYFYSFYFSNSLKKKSSLLQHKFIDLSTNTNSPAMHDSLLQQPRRRQTHTQKQQKRTSIRTPAAPAIKTVIFKGSRGRREGFLLQSQVSGVLHVNTNKYFFLNHLHSITFSCWATQLLGAPTLLEDSQRYIPVSILDTLLNFCSGQMKKKVRGKV